MSPSLSYEDLRNKKLQENKRKLDELKLSHLSVALREASSPKPSPSKSVKRKALQEQQLVAVRRSVRVANFLKRTKYQEVRRSFAQEVRRSFVQEVRRSFVHEVGRNSEERPRISYRPCKRRDLSNRVYASDEERMYAQTRAEEVEAELGSEFPTFVKPMLQSHVTGGFWLGLPTRFSNKYLPRRDSTITLVDEEDEEFDTVYLANKRGLSGGWRGFSLHHELVDGDALVFQLIEPTTFKVHIIRASGYHDQ